ncbi:MAG: hypothetical protein ACLQFR_28035, partial [Streptosporangiaceae bacterium]
SATAGQVARRCRELTWLAMHLRGSEFPGLIRGSPPATQVIGSLGEYMWGGAASTIFWVDPAEDLTVVFMTQLLPSGTFNFRGQLKTLVYPAIMD